MKFFNDWFRKQVKKAWYADGAMGVHTAASPVPTPRIQLHGLCMTACKANGGYVLEFSHYDIKTDQSIREIYVINDEDNLVESVSNTVSMYLLKNG